MARCELKASLSEPHTYMSSPLSLSCHSQAPCALGNCAVFLELCRGPEFRQAGSKAHIPTQETLGPPQILLGKRKQLTKQCTLQYWAPGPRKSFPWFLSEGGLEGQTSSYTPERPPKRKLRAQCKTSGQHSQKSPRSESRFVRCPRPANLVKEKRKNSRYTGLSHLGKLLASTCSILFQNSGLL